MDKVTHKEIDKIFEDALKKKQTPMMPTPNRQKAEQSLLSRIKQRPKIVAPPERMPPPVRRQ